MKARRAIAVLTLTSAVVLAGCHKKANTQPPPTALPPSIEEPAPPPTPTPETQPQPPILPPPATATVKPPKPKHKPKVAKKTVPKQPSKTVVDNGSASEAGQLSAVIPHDEAIHQRLDTAQLLETTEDNLKSINRQLTADEQTTVQQIRSLMQQSRAATSASDTERAYNLALKAHQLSDALVKPR